MKDVVQEFLSGAANLLWDLCGVAAGEVQQMDHLAGALSEEIRKKSCDSSLDVLMAHISVKKKRNRLKF